MRCPQCQTAGSVGILQQQRRRGAQSRVVVLTLFCGACCIEFTTRNGRIVNLVSIDDDGETQVLPMPRQPHVINA